MNFKKTIAKSLVVAMALGMVPMANLESARAAQTTVTFEKETGFAKSDKAKFWGIAKEAKEGKGTVKIGDKFYKISNIQELAEAIDVYSLFKGKAGIIAAGEKSIPDGNWGVLHMPAVENTLKVQVVASTSSIKGLTGGVKSALGGEYGYLVGTVGKKEVKEIPWVASKASIQVKLNDGSWQKFGEFFGDGDSNKVSGKLHSLGQTGSTLYFRLAADDKNLPSKEAKVKLSGQPKAPNVKVDVSKDSTSIKSGMQYQVVAPAGEAKANDWKLSTDKKGLSFAELKVGSEAKDILVRTAASTKKIASGVTRITLNAPAEKLSMPNSGKFTGTGAAIGNDAIVETNVAYDITKGATLTNKSEKALEWALVSTTDKTVKWSTLKATAKNAKKPSSAKLNYSANAKANTWGSSDTIKLFVRVAGTKQDKNNVATFSGVSAGAVMTLKNIEQNFTFESATADSNATAEATNGSTTAAIKVATGTAAKVTIKAKISKVVNPKGGSAKVKATTALPKGVTLKAGKIDYATGKFDIVVDISKTAFKDAVTKSTAEYSLQFEGIKDAFKISIDKKN